MCWNHQPTVLTYLPDGPFTEQVIAGKSITCTRMHFLHILHYTGVGCRWLLALVFLSAGLPKLFGLDRFGETVAAYGLIPDALVILAAFIIVILEIAAGVGLLFRQKWALALTALLLLMFIGVLSYGMWLGLDIDCGCFGPEDPEAHAFDGLRTALVRDILLLLPLGYLYFQPFFTSLLPKGVSR